MAIFKKSFNTILEKDIVKSKTYYEVKVYNKAMKEIKSYEFSSSYTIDEIYKIMKEKHENKHKVISLMLTD